MHLVDLRSPGADGKVREDNQLDDHLHSTNGYASEKLRGRQWRVDLQAHSV